MGTRHLICVVKNNSYRVAQYGQWDGYPEGQGAKIVDFLRHRLNPSKFREQLDRTRHITPEDVKARYLECGHDGSEWIRMDVSDRFKAKHAHLSRDCGAGILDYIQTATNPEVMMSLDFAGDSLFCEWCYVVNLDTDELEIFKGFNKQPLDPTERFAGVERDKDSSEYYQVKLFKTFKFSELNDDWQNQLPVEKEEEDAA